MGCPAGSVLVIIIQLLSQSHRAAPTNVGLEDQYAGVRVLLTALCSLSDAVCYLAPQKRYLVVGLTFALVAASATGTLDL